MAQQHGNRLLAALASDDYEALKRHLDDVELPLGTVLCEPGRDIEHAYFPHSCVVAIMALLEDGLTPEMATIGPEGVVGVVALLGVREAFGRYVVQLSGRASRISLDALQTAMLAHPGLRKTMLLYLQGLLAQTFQSVVCNAVHPTQARCSRWILTLHDRLGGPRLPLTHEFLAGMLGVQRPTVSVITRTLQRAGLIQQHRGAITVTDPAGLEEAACECYGHVRRRFERLFAGVAR